MSYDRFESQNRKRAMQNRLDAQSGRSFAGKVYLGSDDSRAVTSAATPNNLPSNSPTNATARAGDDNAEAVASKIPEAASPSAEGQLPLDGNKPTVAELGLRYTRALVLLAATFATSCLALNPQPSTPDSRWLDAVALVESSNNSSAIGDGGRARGVFQFHRDAWEVARRLNPAVVEYVTGSTNAAQSRLAAAAYLTWLRQRFAANGVTMPTDAQLYAAYNCGFAGFKVKYKFDVARTPKSTQRACARIEKKIAALSRGAAAAATAATK
jgi:hypothetical protein